MMLPEQTLRVNCKDASDGRLLGQVVNKKNKKKMGIDRDEQSHHSPHHAPYQLCASSYLWVNFRQGARSRKQ
jgi:hypothetical protein